MLIEASFHVAEPHFLCYCVSVFLLVSSPFYYRAFKLLTRHLAVHPVYYVLIYPWIPLSNVSTLFCPHFSVFCQFHPSSHIFPPPSVPPSVCLFTLFTFLFFPLSLLPVLAGPRGMSHSQRINVKESAHKEHVHSSQEDRQSTQLWLSQVPLTSVDVIKAHSSSCRCSSTSRLSTLWSGGPFFLKRHSAFSGYLSCWEEWKCKVVICEATEPFSHATVSLCTDSVTFQLVAISLRVLILVLISFCCVCKVGLVTLLSRRNMIHTLLSHKWFSALLLSLWPTLPTESVQGDRDECRLK